MGIEAWTIAFLLSGLLYFLAGWLAFRYLGSRALTSSLLSLHLASPVIVEKIRDGVVLLDVDNRILHVNAAALHILEMESFSTGLPLESLFQPSSETAIQLMKTQAGRWDFQEKTRSGEKWLDMSFSPLSDKKGNHRGQIVIFRDITKRKLAQIQLEAANLELNARNRELDRYNWEISNLHQMSSRLQSCPTLEAAYPVISDFMQMLLPALSGGLYLCSPPCQRMELVLAWQEDIYTVAGFESSDCLSLEKGEIHRSGPGLEEENCRHAAGRLGDVHVCRPLVIDGKPFGVFYCHFRAAEFSPNQVQMAQAVVDTAVLALLNLKLRDNLRQDAIRDPLTNLFNRRYMEEALRMALFNAQRTGRPLSIIMADVDNFKQINDRYGHRQGDKILIMVGRLFARSIRRNDIACRYGGDEFILVMPDAPLQSACSRADAIRREITGQDLEGNGPDSISLSLGVAAYPNHGETMETLIEAADKALYLAKQEGRDRIGTT
ncbi:MAG: diguanylate cyclase [Syntrophomonadaceae bacterium]